MICIAFLHIFAKIVECKRGQIKAQNIIERGIL